MKTIIFFIIFALFSLNLQAQGLKIAVGMSIPPYVIQQNNSGFEIELIKEVLKSKNYHINQLIYASNKRISKLLEKRQVDAALNLQPNLRDIYYSDVLVHFQNVAITLKKRDINIQSILDLHYKRVLAFQNAHMFLGKEFAEYAKNNTLYTETVHQTSQVRHLIEWRVDVAISDKNVFMYYARDKYGVINENQFFNFFDIFPKSPRYIGFTNEKIQKDFNVALKEFKATNAYKHLLLKYNIKEE